MCSRFTSVPEGDIIYTISIAILLGVPALWPLSSADYGSFRGYVMHAKPSKIIDPNTGTGLLFT